MNGTKVRFAFSGLIAELLSREGVLLDAWGLIEPPILNRSGYYLRTLRHGLVLVIECSDCNGGDG